MKVFPESMTFVFILRSPAVSFLRPPISFKIVDFPEPLGPKRQTVSFFLISSLTFKVKCSRSKDPLSSSIVIDSVTTDHGRVQELQVK